MFGKFGPVFIPTTGHNASNYIFMHNRSQSRHHSSLDWNAIINISSFQKKLKNLTTVKLKQIQRFGSEWIPLLQYDNLLIMVLENLIDTLLILQLQLSITGTNSELFN